MNKIRVIGVPEHYNIPWQLCIKENLFLEAGLNVFWQDVQEGTGKMCQQLRENETDIAIVLTEGIIKDICLGNPSKIIQKYVESPLIWGVHTSSKNSNLSVDYIENKRFAISRFGSGSHLMSYVYANQKNWSKDDLSFEIVNNIQGAVEALSDNRAQLFLWEKFMTKPLVDKGLFNRLDECPTPWPCFSIAVREDFLNENYDKVQALLKVINKMTISLKSITNIIEIIAKSYDLKSEDVELWLNETTWSQENFSEGVFENIQNDLVKFDVIDRKSSYKHLIATINV